MISGREWGILRSLGMGDVFKSKSQIEMEMKQSGLSLPPQNGQLGGWAAAQVQDQMSQAFYHGNQAAAAQAAMPHLDPVTI